MAQFLFLFISVKPVATLATTTLMRMMLHCDRNPFRCVCHQKHTQNNIAQHGFGAGKRCTKYVSGTLFNVLTLIIIFQPYQYLVSQIAFPQSTAINGV